MGIWGSRHCVGVSITWPVLQPHWSFFGFHWHSKQAHCCQCQINIEDEPVQSVMHYLPLSSLFRFLFLLFTMSEWPSCMLTETFSSFYSCWWIMTQILFTKVIRPNWNTLTPIQPESYSCIHSLLFFAQLYCQDHSLSPLPFQTSPKNWDQFGRGKPKEIKFGFFFYCWWVLLMKRFHKFSQLLCASHIHCVVQTHSQSPDRPATDKLSEQLFFFSDTLRKSVLVMVHFTCAHGVQKFLPFRILE